MFAKKILDATKNSPAKLVSPAKNIYNFFQ